MKKIIILLFLLCSVSICFADTSAIKNVRTNIVYTNYEYAENNSISGDTFIIGYYNDTGFYQKNVINSIVMYIGTNPVRTKYYENEKLIFQNVYESNLLILTQKFINKKVNNRYITDEVVVDLRRK